MSKEKDFSWMWHCSDEPNNILDYSKLLDNKKLSELLNKNVAIGFRTALRKMEELGLIEMQDINRKPNDDDQKKWNEFFKT
ncbi:hypothetical protein K9M42_03210 [Patescibacteria group bacterium]|nr:hypothetical protein [Patescibacteria group bacterium]